MRKGALCIYIYHMIYSLHISYDHVCRHNGVDQLHCNMKLISVFALTKDSIIPVLS